MPAADDLRITEIFHSLQGESDSVGIPTVFVRLTGCPLRCRYCDTAYAFTGGESWRIADILREVEQYQTRYVTVTGGEPLAQKNCLDLLGQLSDAGYRVSLETSGALDISQVDARVVRVVDLKTPASGEMDKNRYANIAELKPHDQLKFVLCNREDYDWARQCMAEYELAERCEVLMSPCWGELDAAELAGWILHDRLKARMQVQLHKLLWGDQPGR